MRILGLLCVAAGALAAVQVASPLVQAQDAEEGTTVQVGPDGGVSVDVRVDGEGERLRERRGRRRITPPGFVEEAPVAVSRYWIGLGGGPLPPELRAQLDIDPDEGVLVRTVAPDGPAAEAGVQQFDILLRANGKPINDLRQLAEEVGEQGEMKGRITLELLRKGRIESLWVAPTERPAEAVIPAPRQRNRFGFFGPEGRLNREPLLGGQGLEGLLDPEMLAGLGEMGPQLGMSGVSVRVQRQNEGPAKVTVTRGDQTWEFDEGDQEALGALPEDVRPMVEQLLGQNGHVVGEDFEAFGFGGPGFQMQFGGEEMAGPMRALQERMRALQERLGAGPAPAGAPQPQIDLDEAPAFDAGAAESEIEVEVEPEGPVEIEVPAE